MDRPVIGIPWPRPDYLAALERAGAEPRELHPGRDALPDAVRNCDGILLTGGVDVDPREYGIETPHPTVETDPARDAYELVVAREALASDVPLLAICRGVQVLNVAAGGTLVQDIPSEHPSELAHSITEPKDAIAHDVTVARGTCLAHLLVPGESGQKDTRVAVNSRHHQSIDQTAPGFVVSATAPDGVIEAIEKPNARFCVGVQWHPENFWRTGEFASLFEGLVEAARNRSPR